MIFEKTYDKITNSIDFQITQAFETRNWDAHQKEIKKKRTKEKKKCMNSFSIIAEYTMDGVIFIVYEV